MAGAAPQVQYRQEFIAGFNSRQSLLKETVTKESVVKGNQATFLVATSDQTAVTRGVGGLIPAQDNNNAQKTATLLEKHTLIRMTDFNIFQSQSDQKAIMQMNTMAAINRDIDSVLLTLMATGTLETGAAATASLNMISKAMAQLQVNAVPWDGNVFAVISPSFLMYLMQIPSFASADYVAVKPFANYPGWNAGSAKSPGQGWYEWMGVKWIVSSQISGIATATERCFMYHRNAIGHAVNTGEVDSRIGYDEEQHYSWSRTTLYHGAVLLQDSGVAEMTHDGSAHVLS